MSDDKPLVGYWVDGCFISLKRVKPKKTARNLNFGWPDGPSKPIRRISRKQRGRMAKYKVQRIKFLTDRPTCQAGLAGICSIKSTDVHHMAGRTGARLLFEGDWLSVCRPCHNWIHNHAGQAREKGLLK